MNKLDLLQTATLFNGNGVDALPPAPEGALWLLREGAVELFVVRGTEADADFFTRHLFSLDTDCAVLPTAIDGAQLKAVPLIGSCLEAVPRAKLDAAAWDRGLTPWLEGFGAGLTEAGLHRPEIARFLDDTSLEDEEPPSGDTVSVHHGLRWAAHPGQEIAPFGRRHDFGTAMPVPVTHRLWATVAGDPMEIGVLTTAEMLERRLLWSALDATNRTLLQLALDHFLKRREENERRIVKRQGREVDDRAHLLDAAAVSVEVRRLTKGEVKVTDPLVLACQRVGRWHGIAVKNDAIDEPGLSFDERLHRIALRSRFQSRKIALQGKWWKADIGALLAFDHASGEPLALVQGTMGRILRYDAAHPSGQAVSASTAAEIAPHAYQFYASFPESAKSLKEVFKFGIPKDVSIPLALSMPLAISALALLPPLMIKVLFDKAIPGSDFPLVLNVAVALVLIYGTSILVQMAFETALARFEGKAAARLQAALFDRVLRLPSSFVQKMFLGKIHSKWMLFEKLHGGGLVRTFAPTLLTAVFSVCSLALMFSFFPMAAGIVLFVTLGLLYYASKVGPWQLAGMAKGVFIPGHYWSMVTEALGGIGKLRLAGAEGRAFNRWLAFLVERRVRFLQGLRYRSRFQIALSMYEGGTLLLILVVLAAQYSGHALPMGRFMGFLAATRTFTAAMIVFARALPDLRMMAADDLPDVLPFVGSDVENPMSRGMAGSLEGEVEMNQLTFRYQGSARAVLDGVTIKAKPGEFVALVGRSGCGKSTVMKLLLGMEKPASGGIFYDGHNLDRLDVVDVRSQIGVVMQNADLIPGTIFDYITASRPCTLEHAWAVARLAGVDGVIRNLPMGMYTFIAEGSSALSGGQMQRLMIARAMAGKPKILFFDEATSWLDNETQSHVAERLSHLQITRIVIAHRLSTIRQADRIYVLDEGKVAATGTFDELMSQGGLFADLARRQFT